MVEVGLSLNVLSFNHALKRSSARMECRSTGTAAKPHSASRRKTNRRKDEQESNATMCLSLDSWHWCSSSSGS